MKTVRKRRLENKTKYKLRLGLLKSGKPRIVVRRTNQYLVVQLVTSEESKDKVIVSTSSRELLKNGWPKERKGSLKSIPAAYLTGYLAGKKMQKSLEGEAVFDFGLNRNIHGNRIYAVLKGLIDSGVNIKHDAKIFPSDERISGKHLKEEVTSLIENLKGKIANG